jgi:hypothetical protein
MCVPASISSSVIGARGAYGTTGERVIVFGVAEGVEATVVVNAPSEATGADVDISSDIPRETGGAGGFFLQGLV